MNYETARKAGFDFAMAHLELAEAGLGPDVAVARASGIAWAARDYVFNRRGARAAFDAMSELADGCVGVAAE